MTTPGLPQGGALQKTLGKLTVSLPPALFSLMQEAARRHQPVELDHESRSRSERFWRRVDPYVVEARAGQF